MARPEKPITGSGGLAAFASDLRRLRHHAGSPPYRTLTERTHYAQATLSAAASGRALPSLEVTLAYVRACHGDPAEWAERWRRLAAAGRDAGTPAPGPARDRPASRERPRMGRELRRVGPRAVVLAALGTLLIGLLLVALRPGPETNRSGTPGRTPPSPALAAPTGTPSAPAAPATAQPRPATPVAVTPAPPGRPVPVDGRPAAPPGPRPPSPSRVVVTGTSTFTGVAGYRCPGQPGAAVDSDRVPKGDGWHETTGGWTGNGCTGAAVYTQTTVENNHWQETMTWTFRPGRSTRCAVDVYVPLSGSNGRAHYDVYGPDPISHPDRIGDADVDQPAHRGRWVRLGTWTAVSGVIQIRLTDRPSRDGTSYRVAASAAWASCA